MSGFSYDYTSEQMMAMIDILDTLLNWDEHLLDANIGLEYNPFKFNNRALRSELWNSLTPFAQKEWELIKKEREE